MKESTPPNTPSYTAEVSRAGRYLKEARLFLVKSNLAFLLLSAFLPPSIMSSPALVVSWSLQPPPATPQPFPSVPAQSSVEYPLASSTAQEQLESLEAALGLARDQLNKDLTEWKDAVKGLEGEQKKKKGKKNEEEDDEEEEEEEE